MKSKKIAVLLLLLCLTLLLTACIPGDGSYNEDKQANFLSGVWHGWIAPVSLIVGLFQREIRIYEPVNTGWWYDFGYYMAIISGFGGLALTRRSRHRHSHKED